MKKTHIEDELIFKGYEDGYTIIKPSLELLAIRDSLQSLKDNHRISINSQELKTAIYKSKEFMETYFHIHRVNHWDYEEVKEKIETKLYQNLYEALDICKKLLRIVNPYDLPILKVEEQETYGALNQVAIESSDGTQVTLNIFYNIAISKFITDFTTGFITHEIVHTQLLSKKGSVKSFVNSEILSIFIQLINNLELDSSEKLLKNDICFRKTNLYGCIDYLDNYHKGKLVINESKLLEFSKYLVSTLKAFNLFQLYYFSNSSVKKEILKDIQDVFDGNLLLEDLLLKYDINQDSSIKVFTKTMR